MTGRIDELETLADNSVERRTVLRGDYAPGITSCDEEADGAIGGGVMGGVIGAIVGGPVGAVVGGAIGAATGATAGAIDEAKKDETVVVRRVERDGG
jgi:outer membrane lipoprotein SlyB